MHFNLSCIRKTDNLLKTMSIFKHYKILNTVNFTDCSITDIIQNGMVADGLVVVCSCDLFHMMLSEWWNLLSVYGSCLVKITFM